MAKKDRIEPAIETLRLYRRIGVALGMPDAPDGQDAAKPADLPGLRPKPEPRSFKHLGRALGVAPTTIATCIKTLEKLTFGEARSSEKGKGSKPGGKQGLLYIKASDSRKSLTPAGKDCYWKVVEILRVHESFGAPAQPQRDHVTIGSFNALMSSYMPLALKPFLSMENPRERPVIRLHELDSPEIFQAVASQRLDFAIGSVPTSRDKTLAEQLVKVERLDLTIERGLLLHPEHRLAAKKTIVADDMAREVVFRFPVRATSPGFDTWLNPDYEQGGDAVEVLTFGVMLGFVKQNLGVAVVANLPGEIQDAVELGKVVYRPLHSVESAVVAAYLPKKSGVDGLSPGAKRVYLGIEKFFRDEAARPRRAKRQKK